MSGRRGVFRGARAAARVVLPCACLSALACNDREITTVDVGAVTVRPPAVSVLEGQSVPLTATVREPSGALLEGATVDWASDDPAVASVEPDGTVTAHSEGSTRITASFRDVSGEAPIDVRAGPSIQLSHQEVTLYGESGGSAPSDAIVSVTNGGAATIDGLAADVSYPAGAPAGWLDAEIAAPVAPTELAVAARPQGLSVGTHRATVTITADAASNSPVELPVSFTLAEADDGGRPDLDVDESDGGTTVTEALGAGRSDEVLVALTRAPASNVLFAVVSADPLDVIVTSLPTLVFTPSNWSQPQTVTVAAVNDFLPDGDRITQLTMAVVGLQSDAAFAGVSRVVDVRSIDDDLFPTGASGVPR